MMIAHTNRPPEVTTSWVDLKINQKWVASMHLSYYSEVVLCQTNKDTTLLATNYQYIV